MIRTLIVDDEPLAHKVLEGYCEKMDIVELIGHCYDGISSINFLSDNKVDLVLLDIQMPDLSGIEVLTSMRSSPKVIFTTAYSEYAIEGYNFEQVVDYLLKPVALARFVKSINRVKKILDLEGEVRRQELKKEEKSKSIDFINLKENGTVFRIALKEILYIQSWGNYVKMFLLDGDIKLFRMTFKQLLTILPSATFLRIHKSYIVNLQHVVNVKRKQLLLREDILPIGNAYSMLIKDTLS